MNRILPTALAAALLAGVAGCGDVVEEWRNFAIRQALDGEFQDR